MAEQEKTEVAVDALVVGAGFAGLYQLHRLRGLGFSTVVLEAGDGVGGTWYWNRYPGARCDVESLAYSYSFDEELQQEWEWTERYSTQPEILSYVNHVADRFDLRKDIRFETRVTSAAFDEDAARWHVGTDRGDAFSAQFLIMATGCLSLPKKPEFPGLDDFRGDWYHTGAWPHEGVDFAGKRVGVIGTGSTGIQSIPIIARQAERLTVFQRTPNFSVPAGNRPLDPEEVREVKATYAERREESRHSAGGIPGIVTELNLKSIFDVPEDVVREELERRWLMGGFALLGAFIDVVTNERANQIAADFVREKIRGLVDDPATAELLCPTSYPIGTKRLCVDTDYYETFNRDNVELVSVKADPIATITPTGIRLESGAEYELDAIVFAIGFDAMTGALLDVDIRGRGGEALREAWAAGPRTYLGLQSHGFPNLFTVTGPGSPSVLSNMIVSIEQHVDWITDTLADLRRDGIATIEPTKAAQDAWVLHVNEVSNQTLYNHADSWYLGANVPGKPRVFMPYVGGVGNYRALCDGVRERGYDGFELAAAPEPAAA
jgi:cyclohexanone monooxygenase